MYKIRKKFKFEMAHVLDSSYSKECQKIHGHSYILEVFLCSDSLNKDGMLIDFKQLSQIVKYMIVDKFDHALIVSEKSFPYFEENVSKYIDGIFTVPYNPTAENMVRDIFDTLKTHPSIGHLFYKIRLHETQTGYAEYKEFA